MRWLSDSTVAHLKHVAEWPDLVETKYGVLGEIGRGGMGTIYLAEDRVLGRRVALKVVSTGASDPAPAHSPEPSPALLLGLGLLPLAGLAAYRQWRRKSGIPLGPAERL